MPTPQNLSVEKSPKLWPLTSLIVALSGLSKPSFATHDVQHRYIITGYVTDAEGTLLAVTPVEMTLLGGQSAGEARSVRNGRYSIVLRSASLFHLSNSSTVKCDSSESTSFPWVPHSQIPFLWCLRSSTVSVGSYRGPPGEAAVMWAANPTLIVRTSSDAAPLVGIPQSGFEHL